MNTKTLITSKTFWVGVATIATGVGMYLSGENEIQDLITAVIGVVVIWMRIITTSQIKGIK